MNDFASAAMLRVLHVGMRRLGLQGPAQQWLQQATVPLDAKQQLIGQVLCERGIEALPRLGQGLQDVQHDSLMPMLIYPGQPFRMLQAWLRLERYLHSKHRIKQTVLTPQTVQHHHISIKADTAPSAAEDLVVLGVLVALLEITGCQNVEAHLQAGLQIWPWQDSPAQHIALREAFSKGQTHAWRICWGAVAEGRVHGAPQGLEAGDSSNLSARIQYLASQTLGQALPLEEAAQQLALSVRSLQRKLKQEGTRYVDIIASARAQRASHMLSQSKPSLAEIGFACGYTDQAHFCRDFKRRVGMSPSRYREHTATTC